MTTGLHEGLSEVKTAVAVPTGRFRSNALLLCVLALATVVIVRGIHTGEFDYNVDEAQHGMTGVFFADVLRDLPLRHPAQYAYTYYAQYPAVAIVHWPPLFYLLEGLSFLAFGASAVSARLTILLFSLLLLYQWFRLAEELQDSLTAAISTAALSLIPMVLLFEKTVMLEIPSLALAVAAIRYWIKYLDNANKATLYAFALWLAAAFLCKQTSIFVPVFCVLTLVVTRKWELILRREMLWATAIFAVLTGPFYLLMLLSQGRAVAHDLGTHHLTGWSRVTYYVTTLPGAATPLVLGLSLIGLVFCRRWNQKGQTELMLCWIAAGYVTFTFFAQSAPRFTIYWLPPLVYFAIGFLTQFFRMKTLRLAARGTALLLVGVLTARAWGYERAYIAGYQDAAAQLVGTYHAGIVLFDGLIPGNFVFYMRALDPHKQFIVLRKSLYVSDIRADESSEELLHSRDEILQLLKGDGVRFVVILDPTPIRFNAQRVLRDVLSTGQFELIERFPISTNEPDWKGRSLLVFENKQWAPPSDKFLKIRMLTLNHDIIVPLDRFEFTKGTGAANARGKTE